MRLQRLSFLMLLCGILCCGTASAQRWAVAVNAADALDFGTMDVEASYAVSQHMTVNAGAELNPWTFNKGTADQLQNRKQAYHAGVRYWWWNTYSGWWTGGKLQYREYNRGGIINDEAEEGDSYGLGVNAGYSLMLSEHFNMEFGLGLWGGYRTYTTYACPSCGKVTDSGQEWFMASNELLVSLVWIF